MFLKEQILETIYADERDREAHSYNDYQSNSVRNLWFTVEELDWLKMFLLTAISNKPKICNCKKCGKPGILYTGREFYVSCNTLECLKTEPLMMHKDIFEAVDAWNSYNKEEE